MIKLSKFQLSIDTSQIDRLTKELNGFEKEVSQATKMAITETLKTTISKTGTFVSKEYSIKSSEIKEKINKGAKFPKGDDLTAYIEVKGHLLSLAHFGFTPKTSEQRAKVKAKIKKSEGTKTFRTAFVATTGAKDESKTQFNVFKRKGKNRYPIEIIRTLSVPQMITNDSIGNQITELAQSKFNDRIEHHIIRLMTASNNNIKNGGR